MKTCTYCGELKPEDLFYKKYGKPRSECKSCSNSVNKDTVSKPAKLKAQRNYRLKNKDAINLKHSEYKKSTRDKQNADWMLYYTTKRGATPPWLSDSQKSDIASMYTLSAKFTSLFGVKYHVDHIIPLKGKNICGLHVPWNLQLLPAGVNISKGNSHPDEYMRYRDDEQH